MAILGSGSVVTLMDLGPRFAKRVFLLAERKTGSRSANAAPLNPERDPRRGASVSSRLLGSIGMAASELRWNDTEFQRPSPITDVLSSNSRQSDELERRDLD